MSTFTRLDLGPDPGLEIQDVACGGQQILRLRGEIDLSSAATFDAAIQRICVGALATVLVIDLGRVTFMDSTGLVALVRAKSLCASSGIELRVLPGCAQVQRLFEVSGVADQLRFGAPVSSES